MSKNQDKLTKKYEEKTSKIKRIYKKTRITKTNQDK